VNKKCLQQVNNFKYLGYGISYGNEKDASWRLAKFAQILEVLNNIFEPILVQKFSRIKVSNALAVHILLYGSEIWSLGEKGVRNY
jgi:hypothetical protein